MEPDEIVKAYDLGRFAARNKKTIFDNPYNFLKQEPLYAAWQDGFDDEVEDEYFNDPDDFEGYDLSEDDYV